MVIDITDVTPFFTWLLGPGWTEGKLFQPLPLAVFLLLVCGGLIGWIVGVRKGTGSVGRKTALTTGVLSAALIIFVSAAGLIWKLTQGKSAEAVKAAEAAGAETFGDKFLASLQSLLGTQWQQGALYQWVMVVFIALAAVFVISWLIAASRRGPVTALETTGRAIGDCLLDVFRISPRRVCALAWLGIKESIRRRVIVVFVIFVMVLLFAGWYLDPGSINPARLYLNFVLTTTGYLVILLLLFLSSLSLPADIKNRTLHTIVTKPVRASEVVLGRIAGFTAVSTVLLVIMGMVSYVFVVRGLAHTHQIEADSLQADEYASDGPTGRRGKTTLVNKHRHKVSVNKSPDGEISGQIEIEQGHWHPLVGDWKELLEEQPAGKKFQLGQPEGMLVARVPIYGKLRFLNSKGEPVDKGINVGDEWMYRSYIGGGSQAAAIWTFEGITEDRFPETQFPGGLPVELMLGVFRTHKGNIEKGVLGALLVRNPSDPPDTPPTQVRVFESKEFLIDSQRIPRTFRTVTDNTKVDLFKDFVSDGKLEIWVRCESPGQYFGVAQADMYIRAKNAWFEWNFVKGYFGIWLLGVLVIGMGVLFSTFLSAPVALMATFGALLGGLFHDFMTRLAAHQTYGGGPSESFLRILTQDNVTSELEPGLRTTVVQTLDRPMELGLRIISSLLPDVSRFDVFSTCVSYGFSIPGDTVMMNTIRTFAYLLPMFVAGYLCLKNREIAQL